MYHIIHIKRVSLPGDLRQRCIVDKVTGAFVESVCTLGELKRFFGFVANEIEFFIVVRHGSPCHFIPLFVLPSGKVYKVSRDDWKVLKFVSLDLEVSKTLLSAMYNTDGLTNMSDVLSFLHGYGLDCPSSRPLIGHKLCLVTDKSSIF